MTRMITSGMNRSMLTNVLHVARVTINADRPPTWKSGAKLRYTSVLV